MCVRVRVRAGCAEKLFRSIRGTGLMHICIKLVQCTASPNYLLVHDNEITYFQYLTNLFFSTHFRVNSQKLTIR